MRYEAPTIEIVMLEANDVITASTDKYEIENNGNGTGNVIFDAVNLFLTNS